MYLRNAVRRGVNLHKRRCIGDGGILCSIGSVIMASSRVNTREGGRARPVE